MLGCGNKRSARRTLLTIFNSWFVLHVLSIALRLRSGIGCGDRPPGASNAGDAAGPFTHQGAPCVPTFYGLLGWFRLPLVVVISEHNNYNYNEHNTYNLTTYSSSVQSSYGLTIPLPA